MTLRTGAETDLRDVLVVVVDSTVQYFHPRVRSVFELFVVQTDTLHWWERECRSGGFRRRRLVYVVLTVQRRDGFILCRTALVRWRVRVAAVLGD